MLVGGHGEANPNTNWLQSKGLWFSYCLGILAIHLVLLCIPFLTVPIAWTITNVTHNIVHLIFLHTLKGAPWLSQDQGACRILTHWEQIDDGLQFTQTRKFLSVVPVVLFFLANFYTKYDPVHFYINFISLVVVLLPKLPHFHKVRLFGINKYCYLFSWAGAVFTVYHLSRASSRKGNAFQQEISKWFQAFAAGYKALNEYINEGAETCYNK